MSEMVCESDAHEGVKWNRTYGGYFDLQKCPIDTAGKANPLTPPPSLTFRQQAAPETPVCCSFAANLYACRKCHLSFVFKNIGFPEEYPANIICRT